MGNSSVLLVATSVERTYQEVEAALSGDYEVVRLQTGKDVIEAIYTHNPAVIILDLQIGNMGGVATCLEVRLESRAERIPEQKVFLLLDREADVFLAQEAEADGWIVKPIDPLALQHLVVTETISQ
ncbi:MAG TPA: response regulator [Acidimicrobiales bacterium]|jgi:DNA-binding response OmpR family regulator|nr:response regulator [Acidimicrobiales bacterium]|tara:strand:+ start:1391 stop:1768 length:378 start_codon:yes stop_codon:yes gene_type:complete